ncbi:MULTISPECIES: BON domain-containing protein [Methyloversatilis]|jgi:hyperosmotically inducible periplasmic protein|uniref:BON domain-containing protein n=1 Tax=Methyloversatilis TaxID=378210 RepID=UPI0025CF7AD1|nr:BON domain-containing protein [Methyloversatilis sp.]MCR6666020.1 BON domain-containing protein [Methyloversatilis sp.]
MKVHSILAPALAALVFAGCGERPDAPPADSATVLEPSRPSTAEAVPAPADGVLKTRVVEALRQDSSLNTDSMIVTVREGEVKLNGVVPAEQITRADTVVRKVDGVRVVINALRPTTPSS